MVVPYFGGLKDGNPDVVDLAVELQKNGHEITVLTTRWNNDKPYEDLKGVRIHRVKPIFSLSQMDYSLSFPLVPLLRLIRKSDVDVVHGVMEFGTQTLLAAAVSSLLKKPFVLTIQGAVTTFGSPYVDAAFSIFDHTIVRTFSIVPKRVIVLGNRLSERAKQIGISRSRVRVIPSGINSENEFNPELFDPDVTRKELGLQSKILVGFVGRLVRLKGLSFLLHALKTLQNELPNLHLVVTGDGPDKAFTKKTAEKLNLPVTMTGWIRRNELPRLISAIDIFVNPSLSEGLPIAVMEAMAMQKPVIATNVGGTEDLVKDGENGFLVPPRDTSALAFAIRKLANNADMRLKMGLMGRDIIERGFCFSTVAAKVSEVYKDAIL
jgi:glycosyltransferase involved in cell wall biosynthesis